jgi:hypothetical protein
MKTFSSGFQSKLDGESFVPVIFCRYELVTYVPGDTPNTGTKTTTNYYWSEREITYDGQLYETRLVNVAPLEQTLDASNQVFGEMGLQIVNTPTNLAGAIQPGMKVTVYYGFEDSVGSQTVTEAETVFTGLVSGDVEITEDSLSFSIIDVAHSYDRQLPRQITRDDYPLADPDSVGDTVPIIMGRVKNHECKPVVSGFATTLAKPVTVVKLAGAKARHVATAEFYLSDDAQWYLDMWRKYGIHPDWSGDTTDIMRNSSVTTPNDADYYFKPYRFVPVAFIGESIATAYSFFVEDISYDSDVGFWKVTAKINGANLDNKRDEYGIPETTPLSSVKFYGYDEFGYTLSADESTVTYSDRKSVAITDEAEFEIPVGTQITFHDPFISYSGGRWQEVDPDTGEEVKSNVAGVCPYYARPNHVNTYNVFWFSVADHAVADIRNIKINNIPIEELTDENMHLLEPDATAHKPKLLFTTGADSSDISDEFINRKTYYRVYNSDYGRDYISSYPNPYDTNYTIYGNQVKAFPLNWDEKFVATGNELELPTRSDRYPFDETLKNRCLIAIFQPSNKSFLSHSKASGQNVLDNSLQVVDNTQIYDGIAVIEPGHRHGFEGEQLYDHEIDMTYEMILFYNAGASIEIKSGSFKQILFYQYGSQFSNPGSAFNIYPIPNYKVQVPTPWRFTSDSPTWTMSFRTRAYTQSYATIKSIDYSATVTNVITGAQSSTIGSVDLISTVFGEVPNRLHTPTFVGEEYVTDPGYALAETEKTGTVTKAGQVELLGNLVSNSNSVSDAFLGGNVTCDVVGICDGSMDFDTGVVRYAPHQMIRKLIDTYALNQVAPVDYGDGTSGIVEFEDEDELDNYFDKIYNEKYLTIPQLYGKLNSETSDAYGIRRSNYIEYNVPNPSPLVEVHVSEKNYLIPAQKTRFAGMHNLDFAITEPNRLRDIIGEMLHHTNCVINWRNGIAVIKHHPDSPAEDDVLTKQDVIMKSMSLSRKDITSLGTDVSVRYDYNPIKGFEGKYSHDHFGQKLDATQVYGTFSQERNEDLPMIREQVAAEIIAKRIYDKGIGGKFIARFDTVIKSVALEPGDFVSVEMPVFQNSFLNRGVVTRKVIQWGSAVDREPDLITFEVDQNYTPDPTKVVIDTLTDSLTITDVIGTYLNYDGFNYLELSDSITLTDDPDFYAYPGFKDSVTITESIGFDKQLKLTDSITIEGYFRRSSPLFWAERLSDRITIVDDITAEARDSVYENGVFVETDLTTVGVFE